jgi:hypothetical protein
VQPAIDLASHDRLVSMFTFNFIILQNFSAYVVPFTLHAYFACMQNGGSVSLATILQSKIVALVMQRALQQNTCLFIQIRRAFSQVWLRHSWFSCVSIRSFSFSASSHRQHAVSSAE